MIWYMIDSDQRRMCQYAQLYLSADIMAVKFNTIDDLLRILQWGIRIYC
jgi:hypothetical protein